MCRPGVDNHRELSSESPTTRARGLRVLVIEDNRDGARALALLLGVWGHEVRIAHDGPTGLKTADAFLPEVVLSDIGLPGIDGFEVARRLRSEAATKDALLVSVTAYGTDEVRRRALATGFDHHLVKPLDPEHLKRLLSYPMYRKFVNWQPSISAPVPRPSEEHAAIRADDFEFLHRKEDLFDDGVATVFGVRRGRAEPQAFCFRAGKFSPREARDWLRERGFSPLLFVDAASASAALPATQLPANKIMDASLADGPTRT